MRLVTSQVHMLGGAVGFLSRSSNRLRAAKHLYSIGVVASCRHSFSGGGGFFLCHGLSAWPRMAFFII